MSCGWFQTPPGNLSLGYKDVGFIFLNIIRSFRIFIKVKLQRLVPNTGSLEFVNRVIVYGSKLGTLVSETRLMISREDVITLGEWT